MYKINNLWENKRNLTESGLDGFFGSNKDGNFLISYDPNNEAIKWIKNYAGQVGDQISATATEIANSPTVQEWVHGAKDLYNRAESAANNFNQNAKEALRSQPVDLDLANSTSGFGYVDTAPTNKEFNQELGKIADQARDIGGKYYDAAKEYADQARAVGGKYYDAAKEYAGQMWDNIASLTKDVGNQMQTTSKEQVAEIIPPDAQPFYTKINPYYAAAAAGGIPVALAGAYAAKRYFDSKKNKQKGEK